MKGKEPGVQQQSLLELVATMSADAVRCFTPRSSCNFSEADMSSNFWGFFVNKIENGVPATELKIHRLTRGALDTEIREELGDHAETTLAHLFDLSARADVGAVHRLMRESGYTVFFIRDSWGELRLVTILRRSPRWKMDATRVDGLVEFGEGALVVSR